MFAGKDGARSLKVPNIKHADEMTFAQFVQPMTRSSPGPGTASFKSPIFRAQRISLTNPGTVGTLGSVPRLMPGQGAIIATGAMDFPAEFAGVTEETRATLGFRKC